MGFKNRKGRWLFVLLSAVIIINLMTLFYRQNNSIEVTAIEYINHKLPENFRGYRILQISDLHNKEFGEKQERLILLAQNADPDMIVITGDLIDRNNTDISSSMDFIRAAVKVAPVYFVPGNHEKANKLYKDLKRELITCGVIILENEYVQIVCQSDKINIMGIVDPTFLTKNESFNILSNKLKQKIELIKKDMQSGFAILLSHRPEFFDLYVRSGIDLVFCGHAHGGQIRLPIAGAVFAPNQGFFPKYTSGIYRQGNTSMVVSRGLGGSLFPTRINNKPELVVVTLKK